jgi:hypothetical protein
VSGNDCGIENILEADKLRHGFEPWCPHYLMRRPARNGAPIFENDHLLAQRKHLVPAVRDIHDRDSMLLVPGAQIIHNLRLGGGIERRQRFVQQKDSGIDHQGAGQRDSLPLSTRNLPRPTPAQMRDAERFQNGGAAPLAFSAAEAGQPVLHVALDGQMGK